MNYDKDIKDLRAALLLGAVGILTTGVFSLITHAWFNAACNAVWCWLILCVRRSLYCQQKTRDLARLTDAMLGCLYERD